MLLNCWSWFPYPTDIIWYVVALLTLQVAVGSSAMILITSSAEGKLCLILCSSTSLSNVIIFTPTLAANLKR